MVSDVVFQQKNQLSCKFEFCYVICKEEFLIRFFIRIFHFFSLEIRQITRSNHFHQSQKCLLSGSHHSCQGRVSNPNCRVQDRMSRRSSFVPKMIKRDAMAFLL